MRSNASQPATGRVLKLFIAERNPLVLTALGDLVSRDDRFEIVASCPNGGTLIEFVASGGLDFDIVVAGWSLADMTAGRLLSELRRRRLSRTVVVFCEAQAPDILKQCVRSGAQGFCYQFDGPDILFRTLVAVGDGRICIPKIDLSDLTKSPLSKLTACEQELLAALSDGLTNLQIASRIGISVNTVKYHLKNLYEKLEVRNRAMAIGRFVRETNSTL